MWLKHHTVLPEEILSTEELYSPGAGSHPRDRGAGRVIAVADRAGLAAQWRSAVGGAVRPSPSTGHGRHTHRSPSSSYGSSLARSLSRTCLQQEGGSDSAICHEYVKLSDAGNRFKSACDMCHIGQDLSACCWYVNSIVVRVKARTGAWQPNS